MRIFFLLAYGYYRVSIFAVCLFPLVFFMTLIGATEFPVTSWTSPQVRSAWLLVHVGTALIGYAALVLAAMGAMFYLVQERQLKRKEGPVTRKRLPPLATLDQLITPGNEHRISVYYHWHSHRDHLGLCRSGNSLGFRPENCVFSVYLGDLSGNDFPARLRGLERPPDGMARSGCAWLRGRHLGHSLRHKELANCNEAGALRASIIERLQVEVREKRSVHESKQLSSMRSTALHRAAGAS